MTPPEGAETSGLAARQRAVVAALTGTGPIPTGLDTTHLDTARRALLRKRARELHHTWPLLTASLDADLVPLFMEFAAQRPTRGQRTDGHDFAQWLDERRLLPAAGAFELAEARLYWCFITDGPPQPHTGPFASATFPGGRLVRIGRRVRTVGRLRMDR